MVSAVWNSVRQSLSRLGTDYVDVLQVHQQVGSEQGHYVAAVGPPPRYALLLNDDDCLALGEAMKQIVQEGMVRFIGITAWDGNRGAIQLVLGSGTFDTAQILYNLLNRTAASEPPTGFDDVDQGQSLPVAHAQNVGVIGIRSHAAGALADNLEREAAPDTEVARDHARAKRLASRFSSQYSSLSQAALRFSLDNPAIATAVPGFKSVAEVEGTAGCSDLPPIAEEILEQLEELYRRQFGV
jgi:L-galactose dehydrogenase/L-glyceraldehyde 3-phosphate reductase